MAFSPDGDLLATGGSNATVKLWDLRLRRSKLMATLGGPADNIRCVAFSPTGQLVCAGSDGRVITLWDVTTQQRLAALGGHAGSVRSVDFSPDGQTLIAGSGLLNDSQTSVGYDANSGELWRDAPAGSDLTSINIDSAAAKHKIWAEALTTMRTTIFKSHLQFPGLRRLAGQSAGCRFAEHTHGH